MLVKRLCLIAPGQSSAMCCSPLGHYQSAGGLGTHLLKSQVAECKQGTRGKYSSMVVRKLGSKPASLLHSHRFCAGIQAGFCS